MKKLIKKLVEKHQRKKAQREYEAKAERLYNFRQIRKTAVIEE